MNNAAMVWRVVDWDGRYESSQSLKKAGALAVMPVSTDLGRVVMRRLLGQAGSAEVLGVWYFLQMVAAHGERRGVLCAFGMPLVEQDLANLSGFDVPVIQRALQILASSEVGLLELVPLETALQPPIIEPASPRKPRKRRPPAFARCPICDADLVALAESEEFQHLLQPDPDSDPECVDDCACDADCNCGSSAHATPVARSAAQVGDSDCARISEMVRRVEAGEVSREEVDQFIKNYYPSARRRDEG